MNTLLSKKIYTYIEEKKKKDNKRHVSLKFPLDKILSLEYLTEENQRSLRNK